MDILPDIQLGPVRDRKDADALPSGFAGVIEVPQFGALGLWVPPMACGAEGKDPLFCPAFLFIAPRAAKGRVKAIMVERLFQAFSLPHIGV